MEDEKILEMFFERSEQGIQELDIKYGKLCHKLSYNILNSWSDAEECVNDGYLSTWNAVPPTKPKPYHHWKRTAFTRNMIHCSQDKSMSVNYHK